MSQTHIFNRVALIGLGHIGSSFALALRRGGLAGEIVGTARTQETVETALRLGFIDRGGLDPVAAVAGADLVVICAPVGAIAALGQQIAPHLEPGCILSDVGSTKASVVRDLLPVLPAHAHLVPAHPVAGTEHSGPESGFASLFENRWCILTPPAETDVDAVEKLKRLWQAVGANVEIMEAEHHDRVLAITSHVPHLIAYTIVGTAIDLEQATEQEVIKFSAGGFRDFTRIAASNPTMWRDIFLNNREAVLEIVQRLSEDLAVLQRAIRWGQGDVLFEHFTRARNVRRGVIEAKQA